MQRPLICVAIGIGLTAAQGATGQEALPAGGRSSPLHLKKSLALTLAAFAGDRAGTPQVGAGEPTVTDSSLRLHLSTRLPTDNRLPIVFSGDAGGASGAAPGTSAAGAGTGTPAAVVEPDAAIATLIDQSRFWSSQGRDDLAVEAIDKLFRLAPENLTGLELLARVQVRRRQPDQVRSTLARMRRQQPDALGIRHVEALLRMDGSDRAALRAVRELSRAGRPEEAAAAMRTLYPDGLPSDELTLEYWSMIAAAPNGRARAIAGLQQLTRAEPGNLGYRLALDDLLVRRAPVDRKALAQIIALVDVPAFSKRARAVWRNAMLALDDSDASIALLRAYVAHESNDSAVRERLGTMTAAVAARRKLLADPYYQAQLAGLKLLDAGKVDAAEAPLQHAYAGRPDDIDLLNGLGLLRLRQRRHAESEALFERAARLDPGRRARWQRMARIARYWGLLATAERDAEAGNDALAEQHLTQARALDPTQPAALLALADLYADRQRPQDAERAYRAVLQIEPGNPSALGSLIGLYLRTDDDTRAQQLIARLTPAQLAALGPRIDGARAARLRSRADALVAQGDAAGAILLLEQAATIDRNDPWLRLDLARLYRKRHGASDDARADRLFAALVARTPANPAALYAYALFLDGGERLPEALATLERTPLPDRDGKSTQLQRRLWLTLRMRRASALEAAGRAGEARSLLEAAAAAVGDDPELAPGLRADLASLRARSLAIEVDALLKNSDRTGALALLAKAEADQPENRRLQLLHAETASALQQVDLAEALYARLLASDPDDRAAALGMIDLLIAAGRGAEARTFIDRVAARDAAATSSVASPADTADLATRLIALQDDAAASALVTRALASAPEDPRLLAQAAQLAERTDQPDQAIDFLQRSLALESRQRSARRAAADGADAGANADAGADAGIDTAANGTYRRLADLLDARSTWVAGALDNRSRSGNRGTSEYRYTEIPLEWRAPWRDGSQVFAQAIAVTTAAGTLDLADADAASRFGSTLLCQPACNTGGAAQHASGLALATGIERGPWRADIGTTPLGFPVQNLVGGIRKKGDLGAFSYSVDLSRRALGGSVLSYAGARDPRTGETWGGVLANGVRFGLSRDDGGAFGAWSSLGLHRLTGTHVQSNDRMQLQGGGYWRVINEDDRLLSIGVNGLYWRFSENAGEYTLGHGGYYSPQRFASLSLPVSFGQRTARLSYTVRAALSTSRSRTAGADYFPTRPDLQAQADAVAASSGVDAHYTASTGRGIGRSLAAAFEYQLDPRLFIGGRFEIDRSTDYAPNRLLFYFRYNLDRSSARPVVFPPEPLIPASQY